MLTDEISRRFYRVDAAPATNNKAKEEQRRRLAKDIDTFLASGGKIQKIPVGVGAHDQADFRGMRVGICYSPNTSIAPISKKLGAKTGRKGTGIDQLKNGKWRARLGRRHIGTFDTKAEALAAKAKAQTQVSERTSAASAA